MSKDKDLTVGNPFKLIFSFAVSLMIGNVFQQLYTFVDHIIIGRKIGSVAFAAIGCTGWFIFLVNGFLIGLIQGFSVILGRKFGENNEKDFERYYKKAAFLCLVISIAFVTILLISSGLFLKLIRTVPETFGYAHTYVNVIFAGIPFLVFYQFFAAVLRSRGNSRIPLVAMTISSICNIVLDLLFICVLNMGVAGAALGTVLSEGLVMVICGYHVFDIRKKTKKLSEDLNPAGNNKEIEELLTVGLPMALQSVITAIGGLFVTRCVNGYGIDFLTGYNYAGDIYALLEIAASSYGMAVISYVAQNNGAKKSDRIRSGVRISLLMGVLTALICSFIMIFFGEAAMRIYVNNEAVSNDIASFNVIFAYGKEYLRILGIFYPLLYVLYILRASLQGLGDTVVPMLSSYGQLVMRVLCALVLTSFIGYSGIYYGEVCAWILADLILAVKYIYTIKKLEVTMKMRDNDSVQL